MKKFALAFAGIFVLSVSFAQKDSLPIRKMDEVVVYSNKFAENKKNIVQKIDIITSNMIAKINAQNTGDLLANSGNVFVQKSQQGGSSPVIRGFEASRVLLVVDGIRMNNAIYRSGHLQNLITVDQNMLERVEVLHGPSSTLFGSDALGGTISLQSKTPKTTDSNTLKVSTAAFSRYSSVNNEKTFHINLSIAGKKWGWLQAYTFSNFGNLKMGDNYSKKYPDFGRRSSYIASINGIDSIVQNKDDRVQRFSGYKQWDISQKILFKQSDKISHLINMQFSNSTDIPRYDRLQDIRNGKLRFASWYYGPQKRNLIAYELNMKKLSFIDEVKMIVSYQQIEESRVTKEYRRYDRLDKRIENLHVLGFTLDGRKFWKNNELVIGMDGQLNDVKSVGSRTNTITGVISALDSRYPNGKNKMNYFASYAQHTLKFSNKKWVMNDGLRLQTVSLKSTIADNSFFNFPFTAISQTNFAATGNIGLIFLANEDLRISSGISSGFRAPNIDDLSKIFETSTQLKQIVIPNPDIKPEFTYNVDFGISKNFNKKALVEFTGYYTMFQNAIVVAPFKLNGEDSVLYNGINTAVFANQNKNQAFVYGFNSSINLNISKSISYYTSVNYTYGRFKKEDGSLIPLDHIPPFFGKSSLNYSKGNFNSEFFGLFNGWKKTKNYNLTGEDNFQYATPDGMPSWFTLNVKAGFQLQKHLLIQAGIENILDRNYRNFASGFSAAGRNFFITLRLNP